MRIRCRINPPAFQSTPPRGGRLPQRCIFISRPLISIHAPARGATVKKIHILIRRSSFQSTPPRGGRPLEIQVSRQMLAFQSTPPRGGRLILRLRSLRMRSISIHAPARGATGKGPRSAVPAEDFNPRPREGGDDIIAALASGIGISIHAPREGGDFGALMPAPPFPYFNPRPPRGGRQRVWPLPVRLVHHFNPRPPRGGRQRGGGVNMMGIVISIHAPREGGDFMSANNYTPVFPFQSTPPARGATLHSWHSQLSTSFQSTPPARGATTRSRVRRHYSPISIHAPREGGDLSAHHNTP